MRTATRPVPRRRIFPSPSLVALLVSATVWVAGLAPAPRAHAASPSFSAVLAWGNNSADELGIGSSLGPQSCHELYCSRTPIVVSLPAGVSPASVAGGDYFGLALGSGGQMYGWGWNGYGDLGDGTFAASSTPTAAAFPAGMTPTAIAAGGYFGLATTSTGNLYGWGYGDNGQLGTCADTRSDVPVEVALPAGVGATAISAGFTTAAAVGTDGNVYLWGQNNYGQLGNGNTTDSACPIPVSLPGGVPAAQISVGTADVLALGTNGQPYAWGDSSSGSTPFAATLPTGVTATSVYTGNGQSSFMVGSDGNAYKWLNWPPTTAPSLIPLPAGVTADSISGGSSHDMILGSDGNAYTFGSNYDGQLGNGTITDSTSPVTVDLPPGTHAVATSAGNYFGLAIVDAGNAPAIVSPSTAGFISGTGGSFSITAEGEPTLTTTLSGKLPTGLSFTNHGNGNATIAGTSTKKGTYAVTIRASNGQSPDAVQTLTVIVGTEPSVTTATSVAFAVGVHKTFTIRTSASPHPPIGLIGSLPPYSVFTLPAGLAFSDNSNGAATISGSAAPGTGGTYPLTVFAWNGVGTTSQMINVVVDEPPTITSAQSATFDRGVSGLFTVTTTTGYPGPLTISASGTLPSGITFTDNNNGTATLSGTPAGKAKTYKLKLTAKNAYKAVTQQFALVVS